MSNVNVNTKGLKDNEELEEDDIPNQTPEATSDDVPEPVVLETTAWQDIKNGAAGVWTGIKKGAKKHKLKIIGGAAGAAVVVAAYLKGKAENGSEIDSVEATDTPLIDVPEPEPVVEETRDLYFINDDTGDFDFVKSYTVSEAEELKETLLNEDTTDDEVSTENVEPETTTE